MSYNPKRLIVIILVIMASITAFACVAAILSGGETKHAPRFGTVVNPASPSSIGALSKTENLKDVESKTKAVENLGLVATSNTVLGKETFAANTTGKEDTVLGSFALKANTEGSQLTALGSSALTVNTTGEKDVAVGGSALAANLSGKSDVAVGNSTLAKNTSGERDTAVGNTALLSNETGVRDSAFGGEALTSNTTGERNVGLGYGAVNENQTGSENVGVGVNSLGEPLTVHTSISKDTAIGFKAGGKTNGTGNVFIGFEAGVKAEASNELWISNSQTETPLLRGNFETKILKVSGKLEPGEAAAVPTEPEEGKFSAANELSTVRKRSCALVGNAVKTKYSCEHKLTTRLVTVSVQKSTTKEPTELISPALYTVSAIAPSTVEVTFVTAPAKGEEDYITVMG